MKIQRNKKHASIITILFASLIITGCASTKAEDVKQEVTTTVQAENIEEVETRVSEEAGVEETVVEEPTEELYIPEGIDITSTLPGQEWLDTFVGNVNEPVAVVFNDNTGRKEVIQGKSEVVINPDEDRIAIFLNESDMSQMLYNIFPKDLINTENYTICILDPVEQRNMVGTDAGFTIYSGNDECGFIEFEIILEKVAESTDTLEDWLNGIQGKVCLAVWNETIGKKDIIQYGQTYEYQNGDRFFIHTTCMMIECKLPSDWKYTLEPPNEKYTEIIGIDDEEGSMVLNIGCEDGSKYDFECVLVGDGE